MTVGSTLFNTCISLNHRSRIELQSLLDCRRTGQRHTQQKSRIMTSIEPRLTNTKSLHPQVHLYKCLGFWSSVLVPHFVLGWERITRSIQRARLAEIWPPVFFRLQTDKVKVSGGGVRSLGITWCPWKVFRMRKTFPSLVFYHIIIRYISVPNHNLENSFCTTGNLQYDHWVAVVDLKWLCAVGQQKGKLIFRTLSKV